MYGCGCNAVHPVTTPGYRGKHPSLHQARGELKLVVSLPCLNTQCYWGRLVLGFQTIVPGQD